MFPTPWSLAMFVLELSKPSGICLAAASHGEGERLVGYLICSRYDTVWHVMNVAVDTDHQRKGLASALLAELYERVGDEQRPLHAGGAALERTSPSTCTSARGSAPPGCAAATTRTTGRTRSSCGARRRPSRARSSDVPNAGAA